MTHQHMLSFRIRSAAVGLGLLGAVAAGAPAAAQSNPTMGLSPLRTGGVEGRVNTAVRLDSRGDTVAMVWTARQPDRAAGAVMLAMSRDGGRTFTPPRPVTGPEPDAEVGGEQPPAVVLGPPDTVYVVWRAVQGRGNTIVAAVSDDGGMSFSEPQALHETAAPAFRGFQSAAVGPDGTLHVTWLDGRQADGPKRHPHAAPRQDVYHAAWTPGAAPRETRLQPDVCFCCKTATGVAPDGTVLLAWRHIDAGNIRDIAFVRQVDGVFGTPVRVSRDGWELAGCPDDGPALAVDAEGGAHLVWPTVVRDPSPAKTVFYATAPDGTAFSPRVAVPRLGGDTMSHPRLALDDRGRPVAVWDEIHDGTRRIGLAYGIGGSGDAAPPAFSVPVAVSGTGRAQYPDVARVPGGVLVAWTTGDLRADASIAFRTVTLP